MSIQSRIPFDDYVKLPGISISRLKELGRSALHYQYRLENPKETTALTLGKAAHCAVLEPERFSKEYAVWTRKTEGGAMVPRRGQHWDAFEYANTGKSIITEKEFELAQAMSKAVRLNKDAMKYLAFGDPEVTMQWNAWSRQCKGRLDWLTKIDGEPVLVGLKSARDCRQFLFGTQAAKLGYHLQWAWYLDGYCEIARMRGKLGDLPKVKEIVVEPEAPHAVVVYNITQDIIDQGREDYMKLIDRLEECERRSAWPGPEEGEVDLSLPTWAYHAEADDISELGLEQ